MRSLGIKHRLLGLAAASGVGIFCLAALAWSNSAVGINDARDLAAATSAVRHSMMSDMMHDGIRASVFSAQIAAAANDASGLEAAIAEVGSSTQLMRTEFDAALASPLPAQVHAAVQKADPVVNSYIAAARNAVDAFKNRPADAQGAVAAYLLEYKATETALDESGDAIESFATGQADAALAELERDRWLTIGLIIGATTLLAVLFSAAIASIMRPLGRLMRAVKNLNSDDGDLSRRLPAATAEFGELSVDFNRFLDKVGSVVGNVQSAAHQISLTSSEIAAGNMDLSARTEQASASLQQTASSMEQITATVAQSTESARQANDLARSASAVAAKGGQAVSRVVSTMDEINTASRKIGDIIAVIDGIAFQTNILALNAAVEAARAGEQGRGFAVVAGEVRTLARRSAEAAREIKSLVSTSVDRVEAGSLLVREAGDTMDDIVASVNRVATMISDITAASAEQSAGIVLVNDNVSQLDTATQQNTALVEETASAAKEMAEQARVLEDTVSVFRVAS